MKKLLILVMSCSSNHFAEQEQTIKETWAKPIIENAYEGVDLLIYKADPTISGTTYNEAEHTVTLRCQDDLDNTFKKTYYVLNEIVNKYEYVFRTNTSTYVNIPLLMEFVNHCEEQVLWTSEMIAVAENPVPYPSYIYGRGNGLLMSNFLVKIILSDGLNFLHCLFVDDIVIGNVLNAFWMKHGEDYLKHIQSFPEGWYRCIENTEAKNGHALCNWGNRNTDFEFLKQFVTIQVKSWQDRTLEENNYATVNAVFAANKDQQIEETYQKAISYAEHPSVFIGSTLGFIPMEQYLSLIKNNYKTFVEFQCTHRDPSLKKGNIINYETVLL